MATSLQLKLYKEILLKKKELEQIRKNGGIINVERDLPLIAAACVYDGVEKCGFSHRSKHVSRPDIHYPFDPLLKNALMSQAPNVPKLPYVVFKKKKLRMVDKNTGKIVHKNEVEKFVGTCAEDNASNSLLYSLSYGQRPYSLKQLTFAHPVRTRTLKRERMCIVCKNIFTEP